MGQYFDHADVFTVVSKLITSLYGSMKDYVPHVALVAAYLNDSQGSLLVERAYEKKPEWSKEKWAGNMIAWFSQRITAETSEYEGQFTRKRIGGRWAYKPGKESQKPVEA